MNITQKILQDIRRHLTSEFDRNFERKGFFGHPWVRSTRTIKAL
jgi:hypothetical protein